MKLTVHHHGKAPTQETHWSRERLHRGLQRFVQHLQEARLTVRDVGPSSFPTKVATIHIRTRSGESLLFTGRGQTIHQAVYRVVRKGRQGLQEHPRVGARRPVRGQRRTLDESGLEQQAS